MIINCPECHCDWFGADDLPAETVVTCSCGNDLTPLFDSYPRTDEPWCLCLDMIGDNGACPVHGGPLEPPQDKRIYNRRQPDGTFRTLDDFFAPPVTDEPDPRTPSEKADDEAYTDQQHTIADLLAGLHS